MNLDIDLGDFGGINTGDFAELDFSAFSGFGFSDELEDSRYVAPKLRAVKQSHIVYENAEKLARDLDFTKATRYDVVVGGTFIFGDFIEAFLSWNDMKAERVVINTLSYSKENVDSLNGLMLCGAINKLDIITSSYFYGHERRNMVPYTYKMLDIGDRFQLAVCGSHMKTCTITTERGNKIAIYGSANLRSSGCVEQFTIEINSELVDFYDSISEKILKEYATIKHEIRHNKLYNLIKD